MAIRAPRELFDRIRRHGEQSYPYECCGFLIGVNEEGVNILHDVIEGENEWSGADDATVQTRRNRYLITADQYRRADRLARERGLGIVGYYHSHPDHPAEPSGFDLDHSCWPTESYVILSVVNGKAATLNSFVKPDYDRFEPEAIIEE